MRIEIKAEEKKLRKYESDVPVPKIHGRTSGFLGTVLTVLYAVYIIWYFGNIWSDTLGGAIATTLVTPHLVCVVVAAVISLVGYCSHKRWAILTAAILMAVSAALMPTYAKMVIAQIVLFIISYVRMGDS